MRLPVQWAEEQFRSLGRRDAHDLALDLLAAYEGSALLANTMRDPSVLSRAARRLNQPFFTVMRERRPFVLIKAATSLDGCIAAAPGRPTTLTSAPANRHGPHRDFARETQVWRCYC